MTRNMQMNNYVTYHLHTENSLLDSCTNYKLYVDKAVELGQNAIAFTEHGNIFNWVEKKIYCDKMNIKYIHGIECYLTETLDERVRDNFHTILLAKNYDGVEEINELFTLSHTDNHFYYKPRISFDEFCNISNNVIKISACLQSPINYFRKNIDADIDVELYTKVIKHYDYLEIQYHNIADQIEYNKFLYTLSNKYNIPLIVGTDTHSLNSYKAECRTILQYGKDIIFNQEDEFDLSYKTYDELVDKFKIQNSLPMNIVLDAINNTNIMASCVEKFDLDISFKYPILYGENDKAVLLDTIKDKLLYKIQNNIIDTNKLNECKANIQEELKVFEEIGMIGFILFMSEMITWCWDNGIPVGFCRGSVGGSTIAYITDIIDLDPIKWGTIFSRFANKDRKEIGDIDIDVSPSQRDMVFEYIINRFGASKTAYVLSMGTVKDKGCIDLIGKGLAVKWKSENPNKDNFENPYSLDNVKKIKESFEADEELTRNQYAELFYYYDGLVNTIISQSRHPAGIIASPVNLDSHYGCFLDSEGHKILSINMEEAHEVSLVKYDILGLQNIEIIKDTCKLANIPYPKSHLINWNDENVWNDMVKYPTGIFQFESQYAFDCLCKMNPHMINDMSITNAAIRPSGDSYRDALFSGEVRKNPSEEIDELLKDNRGYLCFQEDVIKFLKDICGLDGGEADNVRRAIGRKQMDRLQNALPQILEGYCNTSNKPREIAEEEAKEFLQIIEDSSNYMFG